VPNPRKGWAPRERIIPPIRNDRRLLVINRTSDDQRVSSDEPAGSGFSGSGLALDERIEPIAAEQRSAVRLRGLSPITEHPFYETIQP
jgi:hypothetical protein